MKIANIILTSQNGGAEQVFLDYCNILKNRLNHEILAIVKTDAPYSSNISGDVRKIENKFGYYDFFAIKNIAKILQEFDADAVICHAGRSMYLTKKAIAKIKNKKIIQICVNHSNNVKRSIGADLVISVNKKIFYKTIDKGQKEDKSFVILNAINFENIEKNIAKINFQKNEIKIGIMSRFDKTKGILETLLAIKILNEKKDKKFILKIAGNGYYKEKILEYINKLEINHFVEFAGWVEDKKKFFDEIDIFILPSLEETFGLVLLEAAKYSTPIISSNTDGAMEILKSGFSAEIVDLEPRNQYENKICDAILKICNDENLAKKNAQNAFDDLKKRFSYKSLEEKLKDIFGNVELNNIKSSKD